MKKVSDDQFELAYRRAQDERGCSYDPADVHLATIGYRKSPEKFKWVFEPYNPPKPPKEPPVRREHKRGEIRRLRMKSGRTNLDTAILFTSDSFAERRKDGSCDYDLHMASGGDGFGGKELKLRSGICFSWVLRGLEKLPAKEEDEMRQLILDSADSTIASLHKQIAEIEVIKQLAQQ